MPPVFTYALLFAAAAALLFGFYLRADGGRRRFSRIARFPGLIQIAAVLGAYLLLRSESDDVAASLRSAQAAERPIMISFFSNY